MARYGATKRALQQKLDEAANREKEGASTSGATGSQTQDRKGKGKQRVDRKGKGKEALQENGGSKVGWAAHTVTPLQVTRKVRRCSVNFVQAIDCLIKRSIRSSLNS
jgi:hypothetical protein